MSPAELAIREAATADLFLRAAANLADADLCLSQAERERDLRNKAALLSAAAGLVADGNKLKAQADAANKALAADVFGDLRAEMFGAAQ